MNADPLRLSASATRAFATCPFRFAMDYVKRLPDDERAATPDLAFGSSVHKAIAHFFRKGGRSKVSLTDLVNVLQANWDGRHFASGQHERDYVRRGLDLIRRFYADGYPGDAAEVVAVERWLSWPRARRGILATGCLDLVCKYPSGLVDVIDFKTSSRAASPEDAAVDYQAAFYRSLGAIAFKNPGAAAIRVAFRYVAPGVTTCVDFEHEDFLAVWERIEAIAGQIVAALAASTAGAPLDEAFPRRPGRQCLTCPIRLACLADGQIYHATTGRGSDEPPFGV